jgi:hypothetical protein
VKLWDARSGQERMALPGHARWVPSVAVPRFGQTLSFSGDGRALAVAGDGQAVLLYEAAFPPAKPEPRRNENR